MAETRFTPGPWVIVESGSDTEFMVENEAGNALICEGGEHWNGSDERFSECKANAALIAAAPDLYAALAELLAAYTDGVSQCTCLKDWDGSVMEHPANPCIECKSRAALAMARGEEQTP